MSAIPQKQIAYLLSFPPSNDKTRYKGNWSLVHWNKTIFSFDEHFYCLSHYGSLVLEFETNGGVTYYNITSRSDADGANSLLFLLNYPFKFRCKQGRYYLVPLTESEKERMYDYVTPC